MDADPVISILVSRSVLASESILSASESRVDFDSRVRKVELTGNSIAEVPDDAGEKEEGDDAVSMSWYASSFAEERPGEMAAASIAVATTHLLMSLRSELKSG